MTRHILHRQVLRRLTPIKLTPTLNTFHSLTRPQQIPHSSQQSILPIRHLHEAPLICIRNETPSTPHTSTQTRRTRKLLATLAHTRVVERQFLAEADAARGHATIDASPRAHRRIDRRPLSVTAVVAQFGRQLWLRRLPKLPRKSGSTNSKSYPDGEETGRSITML